MKINNDKSLFFFLVEAETNPEKAPLVLWQSGGPGCSSLAAWSIENGPFTLSTDGKSLEPSEYSWNKKANMLFVESPVGVGYSYSLNPEDYGHYNDNITASDMHKFLVHFMEVFDEYKSRDFYVSGESYAGHYVVVTVKEIHEQNLRGAPHINMKGFLIGNGCSDDFNDGQSVPLWLAQHALISTELYEEGVKACKGNFVANANIPACSHMLNKYYTIIENVNPYAVYSVCEGLSLANAVRNIKSEQQHPLFTMHRTLVAKPQRENDEPVGGSAPCIDGTGMESYFNSPEVRRALNVDSQQTARWEFCNLHVNSIYDWTWTSMVPFVRSLSQHYRGLYYSGDVDLAVNTLGTEASIFDLNQTVVEEWRQWHAGKTKQVAGMIRRTKEVTFVTIRGAGHMTPSATTGRPAETLYMFERFLNNLPFE
eukprot:CAMPEP_0117455954 /NCGR_PEP_ID=MMETSP0759-20121206/11628_1 /TAXON_ID=63605 /ORGANISM="Percolomonas cosmopolitus, Strain WS" /LENGTH=424 /DNA_ID=CAMNT_0005249279 /DNA_START=439 /DNA_END=1713 /DNA_ORIENTATION=+